MTAIHPAALRAHYTAFLGADRILLTGHSHQAWPDVARQGQLEAFEAAARDVDDKWGEAFAVGGEVRGYIAEQFGASKDEIALGQNTHELVTRLLSALPLMTRRHIVTTTGEFHSAHRQLSRLAEEGVEVDWVEALPAETLADRMSSRIRSDTALVLVSSVLFETSSIVPHLGELAKRASEKGAELCIDAYHAFSVVPFTIAGGLESAFVVGGGYKYAQWGEGVCFLRVPSGCALRPIYTGWFSDFGSLEHRGAGPVGYGDRGADRFAGSTYDPVSHYRARSVITFFRAQGLTIDALRACSLRQTARIIAGLDGFEIATPRDDDRRGGFVSVNLPDASAHAARLRAANIYVDARGDKLRFGPAPYLTDDEIDRALAVFRAG
jgi:selenocysteine lyase/cysteine desulfurase